MSEDEKTSSRTIRSPRRRGADDGSRPPLRRRPGRGSDMPPACHSLPLPFDSLPDKKQQPILRMKLLLLEQLCISFEKHITTNVTR